MSKRYALAATLAVFVMVSAALPLAIATTPSGPYSTAPPALPDAPVAPPPAPSWVRPKIPGYEPPAPPECLACAATEYLDYIAAPGGDPLTLPQIPHPWIPSVPFVPLPDIPYPCAPVACESVPTPQPGPGIVPTTCMILSHCAAQPPVPSTGCEDAAARCVPTLCMGRMNCPPPPCQSNCGGGDPPGGGGPSPIDGVIESVGQTIGTATETIEAVWDATSDLPETGDVEYCTPQGNPGQSGLLAIAITTREGYQGGSWFRLYQDNSGNIYVSYRLKTGALTVAPKWWQFGIEHTYSDGSWTSRRWDSNGQDCAWVTALRSGETNFNYFIDAGAAGRVDTQSCTIEFNWERADGVEFSEAGLGASATSKLGWSLACTNGSIVDSESLIRTSGEAGLWKV